MNDDDDYDEDDAVLKSRCVSVRCCCSVCSDELREHLKSAPAKLELVAVAEQDEQSSSSDDSSSESSSDDSSSSDCDSSGE